MTRQFLPLQFTSLAVEQEVRGMCAVHNVPFAELEAGMNLHCVLVPAGTLDPTKLDIGANNTFENPSKRLDGACYSYIEGFAFAQEGLGLGTRLPESWKDPKHPLNVKSAEWKRHAQLHEIGAGDLLVSSPDRDLKTSDTITE